jgi:hypothetical protein
VRLVLAGLEHEPHTVTLAADALTATWEAGRLVVALPDLPIGETLRLVVEP